MRATRQAKVPGSAISGRRAHLPDHRESQARNPHHAMGNQAIQLLLQAKLALHTPGDCFEQEADRVAEQVMRTPSTAEASGEPSLVRQPADSEGGLEEVPPIVYEVLSSPGRQLDPGTQAFMESRLGHDFSQLRIHDDARAAESAQAVDARAYTVGHRVVLGAGEYAPGTSSGNRLLAHELAHVIQQDLSGASASRNDRATGVAYRQVGSGSGSTSPHRIVYLDNDVLGEIADGNTTVAASLQAMRAGGADVRISRYNYTEATHGEPVRAGARKLVVRELGITIDEGGGLSSRIGTYKELAAGKPASVQPKDVPVLAAVRAAGPDAELWSLDGGVKTNAKRFGVKLAPESSLPRLTTPVNVRAGLDSVGLNAWEIAADGTPIRRGQLLYGPAMPSSGPAVGPKSSTPGQSTPPAPAAPSASTPRVASTVAEEASGHEAKGAPTTAGSVPGRGGGMRRAGGATATALGGLLAGAAALTLPHLKRWLAERFLQEKWAKEEQAMIEKAITDSIWKYQMLITERYPEIQKDLAQGHPVELHVVVDTEHVDTDLGPAQTRADVSNYYLLFEGDTPLEWPLFQPERGFVSNLFNAPRITRRRKKFAFLL